MVAALLVLLSRLIVVRYFPHLFPESIEIFVGMVLLLGIAIFRDLKDRRASPTGEETSTPSMFEERTQRIINNLPLIAITGALISAVASIKIFGGSEVSIYTLAKAYAPGISPAESDALLHRSAGRIHARAWIHSTDRHYRIGNRGICGGRLHVRLCRRLPFTLARLPRRRERSSSRWKSCCCAISANGWADILRCAMHPTISATQ